MIQIVCFENEIEFNYDIQNRVIWVHNLHPQSSIQSIQMEQQQARSDIKQETATWQDNIKYEGDPFQEKIEGQQAASLKQLGIKMQTEFIEDQGVGITACDPKDLKWRFEGVLYNLVRRKRKRQKGTNIPKFMLKIFRKNLPQLKPAHRLRVQKFFQNLSSSKTRFDLLRIFGNDPQNESINQQNTLHREIMERILTRNYNNILINNNIQHHNKRLYLMHCKKMILRLGQPQLIDRLGV